MTTVAPDEVREDRMIWPALASLTSCLCQEIEASGLPPVCICTPLPGSDIATDYVTEDAGMAWTRIVSAYPSNVFPVQDTSATCLSPVAFEIEIGIAYCAPTLNEDGTAPGFEVQFEMTRVQIAAMAAMRRAMICCFPTTGPTSGVILGAYTPMGPAGGVVGGIWGLYLYEGVVAHG